MKRRDLEKELRKRGWRFIRHGSKHDIWTDGEQEEAIPHVLAWLEHHPDDVDGRHSLGVAYAETGRYELAETEFKRTIELDPSHLFAHNNLASVYVLTDRAAEATEELELSLTINPNQPEVRERLRQLRAQQQ